MLQVPSVYLVFLLMGVVFDLCMEMYVSARIKSPLRKDLLAPLYMGGSQHRCFGAVFLINVRGATSRIQEGEINEIAVK